MEYMEKKEKTEKKKKSVASFKVNALFRLLAP